MLDAGCHAPVKGCDAECSGKILEIGDTKVEGTARVKCEPVVVPGYDAAKGFESKVSQVWGSQEGFSLG